MEEVKEELTLHTHMQTQTPKGRVRARSEWLGKHDGV